MIRGLILLSLALLGQTAGTRPPTREPTQKPSRLPTSQPTRKPSKAPTVKPTKAPVTTRPTKRPTNQPTKRPTTTRPSRPGARDITVLTQNLYLGADLGRVESATGQDVLTAAGQSIQIALGLNSFAKRVNAIANQINETQADLIGLQEVTLITVQGRVVADYKTSLLSLLVDYEEVITTPEAELSVPGVASVQTFNTILKRKQADLVVSNPRSGVYATQTTSDFGNPNRNWQSVSVTSGRKDFLFANTRLDSLGDNDLQALELVIGPLNTKSRVILVGDFHSGADIICSDAYDIITKTGQLHDQVKGYTCCRDEVLSVQQSLTGTYDHIFASSSLSLISGGRIGLEQVGGLYISDHAGVVARFRIPA